MTKITTASIHIINSDHFSPDDIGDQLKICRRISKMMAAKGIPAKTTPAMLPAIVIIGEVEINGDQSTEGNI